MFYFAWVANGSTVFGAGHHVVDETIFAAKLTHTEGDVATLALRIKNPKVGLLSAGRKQWAWAAWRKEDNSVVPLFHGRLVGIPDDLEKETIDILLTARPEDFDEQKAAVAELLKVPPFYDPVFLNADKLDDPDSVMEARPQLWHVGRTDKVVSVSHIIEAEDGNIVLAEDDFLYEGLSIKIGNDPIRRVEVNATVKWAQQAKGTINLTSDLIRAFNEASGLGSTASIAAHPNITTYTGQGLEADWPLPGANIGGGWSVAVSRLTLLSGDAVTETFEEITLAPSEDDFLGVNMLNVRFYMWVFGVDFRVTYEASRSYTEVLSFAVDADVQNVLSEIDPKVKAFNLASSNISLEVDNPNATGGGTMPIVDLRRRSYFNTDRGKRTLTWLMMLARTTLMFAARSVSVTFVVPFETALDFSCRKSITLQDERLPGGEVIGKIVSYELQIDSKLTASCTIACSVGKGNAASFSDGDPTYAEDGYMDPGYQVMADAQLDPGTGDISYDDFDIAPVDDGVDFFSARARDYLLALEVTGGTVEQLAAIVDQEPPFNDVQSAVSALNEHFTQVALTMSAVTGGPFETLFPINVSNLMLAKTIDLEAA